MHLLGSESKGKYSDIENQLRITACLRGNSQPQDRKSLIISDVMVHKFKKSFVASCLQASLVIFLSSHTPLTSNAQTIDVAQLPNTRPEIPPPQDVQPPPPQPSPPQSTPPRLFPPPAVLPPSNPVPTSNQPLPNVSLPFTIDRFEFIGNTVFSSQKLAKLLTKLDLTHKRISFAQLLQASSAITQLYFERGYITSAAYIPPQTVTGGVVKIRIIEGKLEDIRVTGTRRLNPNYVRSRLALTTSQPVNRKRLLEALQLLQQNPLIQNVSADLSASIYPGMSILSVKVTEAKSLGAQVAFDNGRSCWQFSTPITT